MAKGDQSAALTAGHSRCSKTNCALWVMMGDLYGFDVKIEPVLVSIDLDDVNDEPKENDEDNMEAEKHT